MSRHITRSNRPAQPRRRTVTLGLSLVALVGLGASLGTTQAAATARPEITPLVSDDWTLVGNAAVDTDINETPNTVLRLTTATTGQKGWAVYNSTIPTTDGVDFSFAIAEWSPTGTYHAGYDGISFWVQDARETNHSTTADFGPDGYTLGYSPAGNPPSNDGLASALLAVGFAAGFDDILADGDGCTTDSSWRVGNVLGNPDRQNTVSLRGGPGYEGDRQGAYCLLAPSVVVSSGSYFNNSFTTRADATRYVRITIDPSTAISPKVTVYLGNTESPTTQILQADVPANLLAASDLRIGFAGSTGGWVNNNDVFDFSSASVNYDLTFDAQGGTVSPTSDVYVKTASSGAYTLPTPPVRAGYTFTGWYDDPTSGTLIAGPTTATFIPTGSQTLYAHWTEGDSTLPATGNSTATTSWTALGLLAIGTLMVVVRRRRVA